MLLGNLIGWIVAGLVVGALARWLVPGRQNMSVFMTIALGIVGALVGGYIASMLFGPNLTTDASGGYAVETAWPGWLMSVLGGVLVLGVFLLATGRSDSGPALR